MKEISEPHIEIRHSWLATTLAGDPAVTEGTLTLSRGAQGTWLLEVSSGDENHPADGRGGDGWESIQMPLKAEHVGLLTRALGGERIGQLDDRGK